MKSLPRSTSSALFALALITLFTRTVMADVVVSEVVAANGGLGFKAADGSAFDWIELQNIGAAPVDLSGFHLTDDAALLDKWRFDRSFVVPPGGFRIVFASDLDGFFDNEEHTNFKLNSGTGEYIALVEPDGTTVVDEFTPSFPPIGQYLSYGRISGETMLGFLASATPNAANSGEAPTVRILSFSGSDSTIPGGGDLTLTWATENADTVVLSATDPYSSGTEVVPSGSTVRNPSVDTTYRLGATNAFGFHESLVEVKVGPQLSSVRATPATIASGGSTLLEWGVTGSNVSLDIDGTALPSSARSKFISFDGAPVTDTVVPVTINATNPSGAVSATVDITVLAQNTQLPPVPPIVISEYYWSYNGTIPYEPQRFFEIHNLGSEALDLDGIRLIGSKNFQFSEAQPRVLAPGGYALLINDPIGFAQVWPGDRNVIGQLGDVRIFSEYIWELDVRLSDSYGRLIEQLTTDQPLPGAGYLDTAERIDVTSPPIFPDNWATIPRGNDSGGGTPGEGYFEISEFALNPPHASPGDTIMIEWQTNRDVPLTISNGVGTVSGTSGSVAYVVPFDVTELEFTLAAELKFSTVESTTHLILPPVIRNFWSTETAITRGDETTLHWNIDSSWSHSSRIDPEVGRQSSPAVFAPLIQGFPIESLWRYLPDGSAQGPEWRDVGFDHRSWLFGLGIFGYGNEIERTIIQRGDWTTAYFRRQFPIDEVDQIESLSAQLLIDDGAEVYINGSEVLRELLPEGEIDASTRTTGVSPNDGREYREFALDPSTLVEGENLIAVGAHNATRNGADFGFDLGLKAVKEVPAEGRKDYTLTASNPAGTTSATVTILFEEKTSLADWIIAHGLVGDPIVTDSDQDGSVDLVEFATGSDPLAFSPPPVRMELDPTGRLLVKYSHHLSHDDVTLRAESSTDLKNWESMRNDFVFESCIAPNGSSIAESVYRSYAPATGKRYVRLVVESIP